MSMIKRLRALAVLTALAFLGPAALAQDNPAGAPQADAGFENEVPTAPVHLDGAILFSVRGVTAFPAEKRATGIADRTRELAGDPKFTTSSLGAVESTAGTEIRGGDLLVMRLVDADARLEGVRRQDLALVYVDRISKAIDAYRDSRRGENRRHAVLVAAAATVVLAAALVLMAWLFRRLGGLLERRLRVRFHAMGIESTESTSGHRIVGLAHGALCTARVIASAVLLFVFLHLVLGLFPETRWFADRLVGYVVGPPEAIGEAIVAKIPDLFFLVILAIVVRFALKLLRFFFDAVAQGSVAVGSFQPEWSQPTYKLVRVAVVAFAVVVAYPYIPGSGSDAFKGMSLFLGVLFSLGSTSVIANTIAGYSLIYRRAFKLGDRVKIGEVMGDVTEIRPQVTRLRTPKNEEVTIPNSLILNHQVMNYSSFADKAGLILHTTVGIGYETPWRQVEAMLLLAAERAPGVLREPAPFVLQRALGDFCVTYELNVYCSDAKNMLELYAALHRRILDAFNEYGVQIMTPAYRTDPDPPKVVPKDQWYAEPAAPAQEDGGGKA
jgi:small-conductance mechanosensitive channel